MKSIEYLVATMNRSNIDFFDRLNIKDDAIIINQTNYTNKEKIKRKNQNLKIIAVNERGLSKSRNLAIENSQADICVISDDDFIYKDDASKNILKAYEKHLDADVIAFYYKAKGRQEKTFDNKACKINYLTALKISSAQITFKRESIVKNNIKFNELFGAGSEKYISGEENIFLYECLKKGLKIYIEPIYILELDDSGDPSTWFTGYNEQYFSTKGAAFYQMTNRYYWLLILQFAIRKRKLYSDDSMTVRKTIKYMFDASRKYKKEMKKKIYMMGDFLSNTGPAIVNKNYYTYLQDNIYICKSNDKIKRILDLILKIHKCQVVLISGLSKLQLLGCNIAKIHNKKTIYLMHGYRKKEYKLNDVEMNKKTLLDLEVEEKMLKQVDKIVCVSERFSNILAQERPDLKYKITYINNGIDIKEYKREERNDDIFTIISVGGGLKLKNNISVCKAIKEIQDFRIKYIVIGKKDKDGEQIEEYNFVEYHEYLPHEEVLKQMQSSDLYIQNSSFETFGLAIFEAMTNGCNLLLAKDIGALSVIDNINEDIIIKNNNDIEEIKNKIINIYKKKNEETVYINDLEEYSWKKQANRMLNLCREIQ